MYFDTVKLNAQSVTVASSIRSAAFVSLGFFTRSDPKLVRRERAQAVPARTPAAGAAFGVSKRFRSLDRVRGAAL